jgi:hypothetical protein
VIEHLGLERHDVRVLMIKGAFHLAFSRGSKRRSAISTASIGEN